MTLSYSVLVYYITLILCYNFSYSLINNIFFILFIIRLHHYNIYHYFSLSSINLFNLVYINPYC